MIRKTFIYLLACSVSSVLNAAEDDGCVPFEKQQNGISVPIQVEGSATSAFINTGTRTIGVSSSLAEQLGLEVIEPDQPADPRFAGLFQQFGTVENLTITVFGQEVQLPEAYVFNSDQQIANLSLLMFREVIVQVDNPASRICFINRGALPLDEAQNIEMETSRTGSVAIEVTLNSDEDVWLELQLGFAGAISLDYLQARDLDFVEDGAEAENPIATSVAETLLFGPYELGAIGVRHPTQRPANRGLSEGLLTARARRGVETNGQIGYEVLQHFILTMDFEEERMHVFAP